MQTSPPKFLGFLISLTFTLTSVKIQLLAYSLEFHFPFGVHGNSRTSTRSIFIKLSHKDIDAYGEACLPPYLGQNERDTILFLNKASHHLGRLTEIPEPLGLQKTLFPKPGQEDAAMAAVDMALNDLMAKMNHKSFRDWKNIPPVPNKQTAFTIGLGNLQELPEKIRQANDFQFLKIKLSGTKADRALILAIRELTDKALFVDFNQACTNKELALEHIHWLKDKGVLLIEQILPKMLIDESAWLKERSPLPVFADESIRNMEDLQQQYGCFSGLNIKLMKCGGLEKALEMISFAKQKGLKVMLGCMAESSCGTTAMAQLMGYADFVDLDAPLLYKNDPFTGLLYEKGRVVLPEALGLGVQPKLGLFK